MRQFSGIVTNEPIVLQLKKKKKKVLLILAEKPMSKFLFLLVHFFPSVETRLSTSY